MLVSSGLPVRGRILVSHLTSVQLATHPAFGLSPIRDNVRADGGSSIVIGAEIERIPPRRVGANNHAKHPPNLFQSLRFAQNLP